MSRVREVISSKYGWHFSSVVVILCLISFSPGTITDVPYYEEVFTNNFVAGRYIWVDSHLSFALLLVNLVPVLLSQGLSKLLIFFLPGTGIETLSWIHAAHLMALVTIQWLIIGSSLERMVKLLK